MKLNMQTFKKHAGWWIGGAVIIFAFFYFRANAAANAANSATTTSSGVDPNVLASQTQLAGQQIAASVQNNTVNAQANAATTIAQLQAQTSIDNTGVAADVAKYTATIQGNTDIASLTASQNIAQINAQAGLDTARVASQTILGQAAIQGQEFTSQLASNQAMFTTLTQSQTDQSLINNANFAGSKDKAKDLALVGNIINGIPVSADGANALVNGVPLTTATTAGGGGGGGWNPITGLLGGIL